VSNLARYLARHAGPMPAARMGPPRLVGQVAANLSDRGLSREQQRMMAQLREIWGVAGRYFPGHKMPVPRFNAGGTSGAVGFARNPKGQPVPIGTQFQKYDLRELLHPRNQFERDDALQTVLHEWAHNFQQPREYARREKRGRVIDPVVEGGAEGFAFAAAPGIARALGRRYVGQGGLRDDEYRPFVRKMVRRRGMDWMMRGQFS